MISPGTFGAGGAGGLGVLLCKMRSKLRSCASSASASPDQHPQWECVIDASTFHSHSICETMLLVFTTREDNAGHSSAMQCLSKYLKHILSFYMNIWRQEIHLHVLHEMISQIQIICLTISSISSHSACHEYSSLPSLFSGKVNAFIRNMLTLHFGHELTVCNYSMAQRDRTKSTTAQVDFGTGNGCASLPCTDWPSEESVTVMSLSLQTFSTSPFMRPYFLIVDAIIAFHWNNIVALS